MDIDIPFVGNTPEDKQCLQASYAMIRQYFEPDLQITWNDWSEITGYLPGKGRWSMSGLMWFKDNGYEVVHISKFDYADFALRGPEYLMESLDEEAALINISNTDFVLEQARALRFMNSGIWVNNVATVEDIRRYLEEGYLLKCSVNLNTLNGKPGYLSHAVVVKGLTEKEIIIHDPGLPARPNRHVAIEDFLRAWPDLNTPGSEKIDAIRKLPVHSRLKTTFTKPSPQVTLDSELAPA